MHWTKKNKININLSYGYIRVDLNRILHSIFIITVTNINNKFN